MFSLKNSKVKALAAGLMLTLALGVMGCGGNKKEAPKKAEKVNVGIVQLVEHAALDAANKGFVEGLASKGYKEGQNIAYDRQNAQADQSNLQNIAHRFVNNKVNLICAIATPAAQTVANVTSDIPIVATAVTDYKTAKLVKDNAKPGTNVTGTTDMNPVEQQLDLLLKLVPNAKSVGTIYCSSEVNSQLQIEILKKAAAAKGVTVKEATVSNVNDIQQAARSLVGKVQAIYVPTDNVLASAMPTLVSVTEEAKLPVICGEGGMVKAGGMATLGVDYYKLGFQAGEMAADILSGKSKPADMAIQAQKEFKAMVNLKEAEKIGLKVPEDVLKGAELVK
ncbi:ABC transporter substrate-binding protein [Phascolarctobacterium sp.]|uniref:ABC transporter substrate-binding protein n=1 Tax=Phascolarctobacterium sp. TaxID=2049039 RepID=UPI002A81DCEB|nr:ABC transporter substrate-binding protein [Phascolarctobacterium sp.]MDY5044335.1 ABC transporter substrate-binding protein [Phascolarctobacterium sp.]